MSCALVKLIEIYLRSFFHAPKRVVVRLAKRTAVHDHGTALAERFSASFGGMINDRSTYDMH